MISSVASSYAVEESLGRMGLDRIDRLYLHDPDVYDLDRGLAEGLPALIDLRSEGMVAEVGIGVNDAYVAARAVREADIDVVMIASRYTLLEQQGAQDLLTACAQRGVRVVAAAVFNSGLLAAADPRKSRYDYGDVPEKIAQRVDALRAVCVRHGVELPAAAIQYPLRHPVVESVVFGSARAEAVRQNLNHARAVVPAALWADLADQGLIPASG